MPRPGRRRPAPLLAVAGVLGLVATLAGGCGKDPVSIPTLRLTTADQVRCQRLTDALPDTLAGQDRRKTQPAAALGGAWGDPPIVVQCGVPRPPELTRLSQCVVVDGVGWFVPPAQEADPGADATLTTLGYRPSVQLTVPARYRGADLGAAEVELAPLVKQSLTLVHSCR